MLLYGGCALYHWFKSMGCEDIQLEKGERGKRGGVVPHTDFVGRMKDETVLLKGVQRGCVPQSEVPLLSLLMIVFSFLIYRKRSAIQRKTMSRSRRFEY